MQSLKHQFDNINSIFDDIEAFYTLTSDKDAENRLFSRVFDVSFIPLSNLYAEYGNFYVNANFAQKSYDKLELPKYDSKNIIVCFSGGKDSLVTALHYKKLGYNVYLYHVTGLNKCYYDEFKAVEALGKMLEMPVYIEDVSYKGTHCWTEHPMKNMLLVNLALQYGIRAGIGTKVAMGNFYTSSLETDAFDVCGGDCVEMWNAYETIIKRIIPKFHVYRSSKNFQTTINTLLQHTELIPKTISCITPNRFRNQLREKNRKKYGFPTMENRCGSCWKCCIEYIIFCDNNVFPYDEKYYTHCLEILRNTTKKETNELLNDEELWNRWLFYPRKKSKLLIAQ